ncbi:MAG TPA: hypothetical protein VER79_05160, partial [Candidatus Limnocylindrales bacterium]|nr:hypothetical protein [Candidatus Limnocylindrales bacterium]
MDPVKRSPYQPLGVSLRSFARQRIRSYVPGADVVSRFTPPPSWASEASTPLDWQQAQQPIASPQPAAAPPDIDALVRGPAEAAPALQAEAARPSPAFVSQSDEVRLKAIMAAHQAKRTAEAGPLVQRSAAPEDVPPDSVEQAAGAEQPAPIQRRRRGQVIDVTPPQPTGVFDERLWDDLSPQPASRNAVEPQKPAEQGPDSFSQAAADNTPTGEQTAALSLQRSPAAAPPANASEAAPAGRAVEAAAEAAIAGSQNAAPSLQRSPAAAPPANTSEAASAGRAVDAAAEAAIAGSQNAAPSLQHSLDVTQRSEPPSDAAGEWSAPKSAAAAPQVPSSGTAAAPPVLQRSSGSQFEMGSAGNTAQSASSQPPVSVPDDAFEALLAQAESVNPSPAASVQRAVDVPSGSSNAVSSASPDTPATAIPTAQRSTAPAGQASPPALPPAAR